LKKEWKFRSTKKYPTIIHIPCNEVVMYNRSRERGMMCVKCEKAAPKKIVDRHAKLILLSFDLEFL
jgi:hypothetical protein